MHKRIFVLLISVFLFTGCDIEYNLTVDDSFSEKTIITETNQTNWEAKFAGMTVEQMPDYYADYPIPILVTSQEDSENPQKLPGTEYYNTSNLSTSEKLSFSLDGKFKKNYSDSNMAWYGLSTFNVVNDNNLISIYANKFKIFDSYNRLDKLTININTKYKVVNHNADKVSKNVYTWEINRSNYNNKNIEIEIEKPISPTNFTEKAFGNSFNNVLAIILFIIIVVGIIIYCYMKKKQKKVNKF